MEIANRYILQSGRTKALYALGAALFFALIDFDFFAFFALLVAVVFLFIYRKKQEPFTDIASSGVVAPIDGKIVHIDELEQSEYGYRVVIESSPFDCGVIYAPLTAKIKKAQVVYGARTSPASKHFTNLNEKVCMEFQTSNHTIELCSKLKRSIVAVELYHKDGNVSCSQSVAYAHNAHTILLLPATFRFNMQVGQKVEGSKSVIGYFTDYE